MTTLVLHSSLKPYFNNKKVLTTNCRDYYDLLSFLVNSFPNFINLLKKIKHEPTVDFFILDKNKKRINLNDIQANKKLKDDVYYLVPSIVGGGRGGFIQIAIGIAIIAIAWYAAPAIGGVWASASMGMQTAIIGSFTYMNLAMAGASMILGGVMSMMQSTPNQQAAKRSLKDDGTRTENSLFVSTMNTVHNGAPIGITYGMTRVGGQYISGYIKTVNHGKGDVISVSESFTA